MFAVSRILISSPSGIGRSRKRRIVGVEVATSKKSISVLFFSESNQLDLMFATSDAAEASDIRGGMNVVFEHRGSGRGVELDHRTNRGLVSVVTERVALERGHQNSGAERLGQHERVANLRADVAHDPTRIDYAGNRHPEFHFFVGDSMTANDHDAGLARFLGGAAQN